MIFESASSTTLIFARSRASIEPINRSKKKNEVKSGYGRGKNREEKPQWNIATPFEQQVLNICLFGETTGSQSGIFWTSLCPIVQRVTFSIPMKIQSPATIIFHSVT